jgi:hypothetical protein
MVIDVVDRGAGRTGETRRATGKAIAAVGILAVLVVSALALHSVIASRSNRAPYPAAAVGASVRMEMVAPGRAQAVLDQLAGPGRLTAPISQPIQGQSGPQQVVGQLTFRTPHNAPKGGQYALFIIDRALGKPVTAVYATGPTGTNVAQGWDGRYDQVAAKYPWAAHAGLHADARRVGVYQSWNGGGLRARHCRADHLHRRAGCSEPAGHRPVTAADRCTRLHRCQRSHLLGDQARWITTARSANTGERSPMPQSARATRRYRAHARSDVAEQMDTYAMRPSVREALPRLRSPGIFSSSGCWMAPRCCGVSGVMTGRLFELGG